MDEKAYVIRHLRKSVTYRNLLKVIDFKSDSQLRVVSSSASQKIGLGTPWVGAFKPIKVKGKDAYTLENPESILVHNLLVNNLSRSYDTKVTDRNTMIRLLISNMKDCHNFFVHRLDIKSFYESFVRRDIYNKLKSDSLLSKKSINIIFKLFEEFSELNAEGLPRGVGISSALSEVMLKDFDTFMSSQNNTLYYARFVDDIIILTTPSINKGKLASLIKSSPLPNGLEFHTRGEKVKNSLIRKTNKNNIFTERFDFLGYEFIIESKEKAVGQTLQVDIRNVEVGISDEKIKKLKGRVLSSFTSLVSAKPLNKKNIDLFKMRIDFLSKNYQLPKTRDRDVILSGIFYNYKYATDSNKLKSVDDFYQNLLFNRKSKLSQRVRRALTYTDRIQLSKINFSDGFEKRKFTRFSYNDLRNIKTAWM
jgi:hypothetical protein